MNRIENWLEDIDRTMDDAWKRMDSMMDSFFGSDGSLSRTTVSQWSRHHVETSTEAITYTVEIPGLTHEDVTVELSGGGDRIYVTADGGPSPSRTRDLRKVFRMPANADSDRIEASVKHGLLTLTLHLPVEEEEEEEVAPVTQVEVTAG